MGFSESMESLKSFDVNDVDFNNAGSWPGPVKVIVFLVLFGVVVGGGYWFFIKDKYLQLDQIVSDEESLKDQYQSRAFKVANLDAYRQQMADMQKTFGTLLKQLPAKTEVPGLLEDITNTALGSGLDIKSIQLKDEVSKEFYVELPMEIEVLGTFHDLASFISGVAALPRIVTLHDMEISSVGSKQSGSDSLNTNKEALKMKVSAKTYRYNGDAEDQASAKKGNQK